MVNFSERLDPSTVLAQGAFQLRGSGDDGLFGTRDDVTIDIVPTTTFGEFSTSIGFTTASGLQLASDRYRLQVQGIQDRAGNELDGNDDGVGGDDYEQVFTLFVKDFGDAPAPYPTLLADDGAHHEAIGPSFGARTTELGRQSDGSCRWRCR